MTTLAVTAAALFTAALMLLAQPPDPPARRSIQCPGRAIRRPCRSQARMVKPAVTCNGGRAQRPRARVLSAAADALATADLVLLTQWACAPATPRPTRPRPAARTGGRR